MSESHTIPASSMGDVSIRPSELSAAGESRSFCFRWKKVLVLVIAFFCVTAISGYALLRAEPSYWKQRRRFLQSHTPQQLMEMGESLERRLLAGLTGVSTAANSVEALDVADQGPRVVRISVDEVNAWLDQRLKGWLGNQGHKLPKEVKEPMIAIEDDNLVIAFRYQTKGFDQIVSGFFGIRILEDGQAKVERRGISGGKLPLPAETITQQLSHSDKPSSQTAQAAKLLEAIDGKAFDPVVTVDEHLIRILDIKLQPDGIELSIASDDPSR